MIRATGCTLIGTPLFYLGRRLLPRNFVFSVLTVTPTESILLTILIPSSSTVSEAQYLLQTNRPLQFPACRATKLKSLLHSPLTPHLLVRASL